MPRINPKTLSESWRKQIAEQDRPTAGYAREIRTVDRVTIRLPLPDPRLSPNARPHRFARYRAGKADKERAYVAVMEAEAQQLRWAKAVAKTTFFWKTKQPRDIDNANAMLKSYFDGIKLAGLIVDDNANCLTHAPTEFALDRKNPRVEIVIVRMK